MSSGLDPGRSVRPQPSRKRVSPATSLPSTRKHWLPGRVARRVDEGDGDLAHHHRVAAGVGGEVVGRDTRGLGDPLDLVGLHVDRHLGELEEVGDARDLVAEQVPAHVVGVVVGGERAGEVHAVGGQDVEDGLRVVRRVDHHGLARLAVADQVDEVDHLLGDRIVLGDVHPGEDLAEVEAGGVGHGRIVRRDAAAVAWGP